ncbi:MAG: site-specific DNA-methyltransferase [Syntrophorhabdales bacterium]|nr:site-specific DNA-methyltransferase [Syntrophorhabdales bacterium]
MSDYQTGFQQLLRDLFQFDSADLDFGIYRIMNYKRAVIERFISKDLPRAIAQELKRDALARETQAAQDLESARQKVLEALGEEAVNANGNLAAQFHGTPAGKAYRAAQERAKSAKSSEALEAAVYNHLYTFFSRYWQDGDFISKRRYSKKERYAIPYNGEEVTLYWANHDQYYVKSGEYFTDYTWKAPNGVTVCFKLQAADVEQNNVKGEKRFFLPLTDEMTWDQERRILTIPFHFRPLTAQEAITYGQKNQQEAIIARALAAIPKKLAGKENAEALAALAAEKRRADGSTVTLLEHHLRQYTRRNTADFFIHKDLRGFLSRELDFYLKNEVLSLEEMEAAGEGLAEGWFQLLRLIKGVGGHIIEFLAQIEDFQKILWEKKKFITETFYVITVGNIPEALYPQIAACEAQWAEWKAMLHIDEDQSNLFTSGKGKSEKRIEFLKSHPSLPLDTRHFSPDFTDRLLASYDNLDEMTDGLLVHSENWQALNLLQEKYRERVKCIYIDPPFNTAANPIIYKNEYRHSSWLSLIQPRILLSKKMGTKEDNVHVIAIDEAEQSRLGLILEVIFQDRKITCVTIVHNPSGTMGMNFSMTSEFAFFIYNASRDIIAKEDRVETPDIRDLMNTARGSSGNYLRSTGKNCFYPIYVKNMKVIGFGDICPNDFHPPPNITRKDGILEVYPIDSDGVERKWVLARQTIQNHIEELYPKFDTKLQRIRILRRKNAINYKSVWDDSKYSAKKYGTELLGDVIPETKEMSRLYPKSVCLVRDCIHAAGGNISNCYILDYFAGSGTTGHAVINLNREDGGRRKFILVEMAQYFDTVLLPRIKKVTFTPEWKDGKPKRMATPQEAERSPRLVKVIRLESYEDALNNLSFDEESGQMALHLEDYLLQYMLRWETRKSETLLNVEKLQSPFTYRLRIHRDGETREQPVDLPETFNYLIGLEVETRRVLPSPLTPTLSPEGRGRKDEGYYLLYRGTTRDGRRVAVIWRATAGWTEEDYRRERDFVATQKLTDDADEIFVNGDSLIPGAQALEAVFKARMFAGVEG